MGWDGIRSLCITPPTPTPFQFRIHILQPFYSTCLEVYITVACTVCRHDGPKQSVPVQTRQLNELLCQRFVMSHVGLGFDQRLRLAVWLPGILNGQWQTATLSGTSNGSSMHMCHISFVEFCCNTSCTSSHFSTDVNGPVVWDESVE